MLLDVAFSSSVHLAILSGVAPTVIAYCPCNFSMSECISITVFGTSIACKSGSSACGSSRSNSDVFNLSASFAIRIKRECPSVPCAKVTAYIYANFISSTSRAVKSRNHSGKSSGNALSMTDYLQRLLECLLLAHQLGKFNLAPIGKDNPCRLANPSPCLSGQCVCFDFHTLPLPRPRGASCQSPDLIRPCLPPRSALTRN